MESSRSNPRATLTLLLSAIIWGFAFVAQRASMEFVGPFTFSGLRFALGGLVLIPLYRTLRSNTSAPSRAAPSHHLWIAIGVAYTLQVVGQRRVDPARAGIIPGLKDAIAVIAEMDFAGRDSSGYGRMCPHAGGHDIGPSSRSNTIRFVGS